MGYGECEINKKGERMSRYTFAELKPGDFIETCGAMLPNKMRCHKPASYKVLSDSEAKEGSFSSYQVCKMHAIIMDKIGTTQEIPQKELNQTENKKEEKKDEHSKPSDTTSIKS